MAAQPKSKEATLQSLTTYPHSLQFALDSGDEGMMDVTQNPSEYVPIIASWLVFPLDSTLLSTFVSVRRYQRMVELLGFIGTQASDSLLHRAYTQTTAYLDPLDESLYLAEYYGKHEEEIDEVRRKIAPVYLLHAITLQAHVQLMDSSILNDVIRRLVTVNDLSSQLYMMDYIGAVSGHEFGHLNVSIGSGWNLIGISLNPLSEHFDSIFKPNPLSSVPIQWNMSEYVMEENLSIGKGYWVHTDFQESLLAGSAIGTRVDAITLDLNEGWNMIAGPWCRLPVGDIEDPGGIVVSGTLLRFEGAYQPDSVFVNGNGYWLQTSSAGQITLDCAASAGKTALPAIIQDPTVAAAFRRLVVRGNRGSQTLYFGAALRQPQAVSFALPPPPPAGSFDARFEGDSRLVEAAEAVVQIQSGQYPVTVELGAGSSMILEELVGGEVVASRPIAAGEPLSITNPAVTAFRLRLP